MRIIANLFLVFFVADGSISLLDEMASLISPLAPLTGARTALADVVMVMAVLVYLCLGFDRRLPKRVFLPLILFVFWCPLSAWLFPALSGNRTYQLLTSVAQLALGMLPLFFFRNSGVRPLTMPPELFDHPWFGLKNTLVFGAVNLLVLPFALVTFALYTANSYMSVYTPGFMRVGPGGLYMTERIYQSGNNRTIRLAGMIHVGDRDYYDKLAGSIVPGRTIVLAEGVTDQAKLLQHKFSYGRIAEFLGLTTQDKMNLRGRVIGEDALDEAPLLQPSGAGKKGQVEAPDILRADVDVSTFRPPTILLLDTIGKRLQDDPSLMGAFLYLNAWTGKNITPEMNEVIMDDILHRRNREVIRYLGKALERYDTVVIPWGAMHMKEIEEEVLKRGFKLVKTRERVSVDFRKLLLVKSQSPVQSRP